MAEKYCSASDKEKYHLKWAEKWVLDFQVFSGIPLGQVDKNRTHWVFCAIQIIRPWNCFQPNIIPTGNGGMP